MPTTPTKNPVPSESYDDLRFNAGKLDELINSQENTYTDRLGAEHLTAKGLQNSIAGALLPANNLSDVQNKDSSLSNLGGKTAGIAVFKAGTSSAARAAIGAAASGSNIDITELTGLSTALSIAQGGTGGKTANAARTNLGIGTLGTQNASTVSITGGSITGINDLQVADGGTGASTAATARANLGAKADAGVTDASDAAAGLVGQYLLIDSSISALLTSGAPVNVTSLSLPAGDWELSGYVRILPDAGITTTGLLCGPSATSASNPAPINRTYLPLSFPAGAGPLIQLGTSRFNISTTTTIYLVVNCTFSGSGSCNAQGALKARRVR